MLVDVLLLSACISQLLIFICLDLWKGERIAVVCEISVQERFAMRGHLILAPHDKTHPVAINKTR